MKRLLDILLSLLGLGVIWPVILVCVVVARSSSGASGIFLQKRVGQHGKLFNLYKIRTMYANEGISVTVRDDTRITPAGRFMRRYKLDELPQLWNVLVGDMSFVGPRPDVPGYADKLTGRERDLLLVKPGITGPATLKYRNEEELLAAQDNPVEYNDTVIWPDKVRINLDYIDQYRIWDDFLLILNTLRKL